MPKTKIQIAAILVVLSLGSLDRPRASEVESARVSLEGEWVPYEDAILRFSHPKGWKVWRDDESSTRRERTWSVDPPAAADRWGEVSMHQYLDGREKRSLERIFLEHKKYVRKIIRGPKHLTPKGAKCLVFVVEQKAYSHCGDDISQDQNERLACIEAVANAVCYETGGNHVAVWAHLSRYQESGKADKLRDNNAAIFDRFLKGLEFKAVAESSSSRKGN